MTINNFIIIVRIIKLDFILEECYIISILINRESSDLDYSPWTQFLQALFHILTISAQTSTLVKSCRYNNGRKRWYDRKCQIWPYWFCNRSSRQCSNYCFDEECNEYSLLCFSLVIPAFSFLHFSLQRIFLVHISSSQQILFL